MSWLCALCARVFVCVRRVCACVCVCGGVWVCVCVCLGVRVLRVMVHVWIHTVLETE